MVATKACDPGDGQSWPILITFGEDGAMTSSSWVYEGRDYLPRGLGADDQRWDHIHVEPAR